MKTGVWLAGAALGALTAGCGTDARTEAIRFHDQVMIATRTVETADLRFMVSLIPSVRGEDPGLDQIKDSLAACRRAVAEATARLAQASVPDTTSARELKKTLHGFLERQQRTVDGDFAQVLALVGDAKLDLVVRRTKIRDMFVRVQDAEYEDFAALRKVQKAFADEHRLGLREPPGNQALDFLTALGVANGRLELGGKELGAALGPIFADQAVKDDRVQRTLDQARATLAAVKRIVDALVPMPNKVARELLAGEQAYLKKQEAIFDRFFPELMRIAHDPVLNPDTRRARANGVLAQMQEAEGEELARLSKAREDYIREYRLVRK